MDDFTKCKEGQHSLIRITSNDINSFETEIVRWCTECGAIVVDMEVDNRTFPGKYMKMKIPTITKNNVYK